MKKNLTPLVKIEDNKGCLFASVFINNPPHIYFGNTQEGNIRLYDTLTNKTREVCETLTSIYAIVKTPNEKYVIASGSSGTIFIIDTNRQELIKKIVHSASNVHGIQASKDNLHFYIVDSKYEISKYSLLNFQKEIIAQGLSPSEKCCLVLSKKEKALYGTTPNLN